MLDHYVYFIGPIVTESLYKKRGTDGHNLTSNYYPFKIGVSSKVNNRLKGLQTASFIELEVILEVGPYDRDQAYKLEKDLHRVLSYANGIGEWFYLEYYLKTQISDSINEVLDIDVTPLTDRITYKLKDGHRKLAIQMHKFRTHCLNLVKDKDNITYKSFWNLIDSQEYHPLKKIDKLTIVLEEFKLKSISDIITPD